MFVAIVITVSMSSMSFIFADDQSTAVTDDQSTAVTDDQSTAVTDDQSTAANNQNIVINNNIIGNNAAKDMIVQSADGFYVWKCTSHKYDSTSYSKGWNELVRKQWDKKGSSTIKGTAAVSVSHSVTMGTNMVGNGALTSELGLSHTIGRSFTITAEDSESLAGRSKGTYALYYRFVYHNYTIVQRKYYRLDGYDTRTNTTKDVVVRLYSTIEYSPLKKISDKYI